MLGRERPGDLSQAALRWGRGPVYTEDCQRRRGLRISPHFSVAHRLGQGPGPRRARGTAQLSLAGRGALPHGPACRPLRQLPDEAAASAPGSSRFPPGLAEPAGPAVPRPRPSLGSSPARPPLPPGPPPRTALCPAEPAPRLRTAVALRDPSGGPCAESGPRQKHAVGKWRRARRSADGSDDLRGGRLGSPVAGLVRRAAADLRRPPSVLQAASAARVHAGPLQPLPRAALGSISPAHGGKYAKPREVQIETKIARAFSRSSCLRPVPHPCFASAPGPERRLSCISISLE